MATEEDDQRMSLDQTEDVDDSASGSDNGDSGDEGEANLVEWLATSREKRSTAGNRMKSMLAAEEPDDELELLFAEDGDDGGFTDVEDDGSDVHMDSSSDDEDRQENGDEDEGEKELEKQARESRQAARKRKAQEAIPMKFRKKVKINTDTTNTSTSTPQPRPKKKPERTSWLPSMADMPTRASKRETTMLSKEQLHQQMIEREVKRIKQVEAMERKQKKMEALKKPPMTQEERLAEAAIVEKRNAKSLNRWEEAEKQREEERRAKLAALNDRTLDGPVVTFWSGVGEWVDGKLKRVGKIVTIEEKPKKKRASAAGVEELSEAQGKDKEKGKESKEITKGEGLVMDATPALKPEEEDISSKAAETTGNPSPVDSEAKAPTPYAPQQDVKPSAPSLGQSQNAETSTALLETALTSISQQPTKSSETKPAETKLLEAKLPEAKPSQMRPPDMRPPESSPYTTSMFAPPHQLQIMKPPDLKPPSKSFLAPPPGATKNGLTMPMLGYSPTAQNSSNVLAPPNTTQRQSPLSMPQSNTRPPPAPKPPSRATKSTLAPSVARPQTPSQLQSKPLGNLKPAHTNAQRRQASIAEAPPSPPPAPPANGKATRNCIILQNFDENAIKEKAVQTRILFGKDMSKLGKQAPPPRCVITNHPARYKDPKTGLPYYDRYAFREIQKLQRGEYKWSQLLGAWVGSGFYAAMGVPDRFLDPNALGPVKKMEAKELDASTSTKQAEQGQVPGILSGPSPAESVLTPQPQLTPTSQVQPPAPLNQPAGTVKSVPAASANTPSTEAANPNTAPVPDGTKSALALNTQ